MSTDPISSAIAQVKAFIADARKKLDDGKLSWAEVAELGQELTELASTLAASFNTDNDQKKDWVVRVVTQFLDVVVAAKFGPIAYPAWTWVIRPALLAATHGVVEWIYQKVVKPKVAAA